MIADKGDSVMNLFERLKIMYESIPEQIRIPEKEAIDANCC